MSPFLVADTSSFLQPRAFATRSFPPGCGRATSGASAPLEDGGTSGNPPPTEASFRSDVDPVASARANSFCTPRAFSIRTFPKGCGPIGAADVSKPFNFSDLLGSMERMRSKIYGIPKRRKISAVRTFPIGLKNVVGEIRGKSSSSGEVARNPSRKRCVGDDIYG
ncbi:hypothetical protein AXF42_Ash021712 [Apostasia shenzhenica]|uniref:Uncharacterized protein n=1 Tax=Apostasia shenzhenica TaxID=1088818 RepID=A0A2H9ZYP4_9ASPA|nr:hypothetical protein AXF42_Ash021712 [Apostasia shenzhenica]